MGVRELVQAIDIVDYIGQYVDLTLQGEEYWGISPFTSPPEKTPSFSVRREEKTFYDFSSGCGGNVFNFTKRYFHCSSGEAAQKLADFAGVDPSDAVSQTKLAATEVCKRFLRNNHRKNTGKNNIFPERCLDRYENCPEKLAVWAQEGISEASMQRFQVLYDRFSDRLVYPIRNLAGQIENIGGRTLDPDWKAKKLRKYNYFYGWDGGLDVIYGLFENLEAVKAAHEVILFEGCKSVLLADTYGIKNAGALLTSHMNEAQMKILARLGCRVVLALDKEIDPREDKHIQRLKKYVSVSYLHDEDDLLEPKDSPIDRGKAVFETLYAKKIPLR